VLSAQNKQDIPPTSNCSRAASIREVVTTDPETARALDNDVHAKLLDMLVDEEMTVEAMREELQRRGEGKAETTARHHVDVLKNAGMVEISRPEEAGGGTRKYYR
jgi:DNA-binding transcriptional ArsR family regulator